MNFPTMKTTAAVFASLYLACAQPAGATTLTEADEIAIALSAAPEQLRADAGVYVLRASGFARVRESHNGFTCLINRELPASFEPECFDAEGAASIVPVILYQAELRAQNLPVTEIDRAVGLGFATGRFRAPTRPGVCYMLSNRNVVVTDRKAGRAAPAGPHLMFYAPYARGADYGAPPDLRSHFLIADEGTPFSMIIVPVSDSAGHAHAGN
jgi:hypothetical protein